MEGTLKNVYAVYIERTRNLHYLEGELRHYELREKEKKNETERALRKMRKMLKEEELRILRGEQDIDEDNIDERIAERDHEVSYSPPPPSSSLSPSSP